MKLNYILDNFESLVYEIKNPKISQELTPTKVSQDSKYDGFKLYRVSFQENNKKINYRIDNPITKIHPCASDYKYCNHKTPHTYISLIDKIVSELQINSFHKEYYWRKENDETQLYIKVESEFKKETEEIQFFNYCYNTLKNENEIIENFIKVKVLKCKTSEQTIQFIHKNQYALDKFISRLIKRIGVNNVEDLYRISENYDRIDCLKLVFNFAERLLAFLESDYFSFLNPSIKISNNTLLKSQHNLSHKSEYIKSRIGNFNLDEKLIQIAFNPILKLKNSTFTEQLTCNEYEYCSRFISKAFRRLKNNDAIITDKVLANWLYKTNLNTLVFFDYLTDEMIKEIEQCDTNAQKLAQLFKMLKVQNQEPNSLNPKLKLKLPSIKQQLINWLEEEAEYIRKKIDLEENLQEMATPENKIKLLSGLSVAQLSYFSNLLLQVGIIKHDNHSEVLRFMANNFKTTMTDKISTGSFRSKYYNVEDSTKSSVREKIIDLLNLTKL